MLLFIIEEMVDRLPKERREKMILEKLRKINEDMLVLYKDDKAKTKRQKSIQKVLNDDKCFFKMTIDQSYDILRDLGIEEGALRSIYYKLIDTNIDAKQ